MNLKKEIHIKWSRKNTIFLLTALGLFGILLIIYFFFFKNTFSTQNILLQISAPEEIVSGKKITWLITIKNNSEVSLENLNLDFEYPSGVFGKDNSIEKRESKKIEGTLLPHQEISEDFSGTIFGIKEEVKEAKAFLTYTPAGLSTEFENQASFSTRISDTSVVFLMDIPKKVNPQEKLSISLKWQSVFPFPLENIQVRLTLPEGFKRTSLKTQGEEVQDQKIIFNIGVLNENEGGQVNLSGKIEGEVGDQKLFRADFGVFDERLYEFVALASAERSVKIISSTLDVFRKINGDYDYIASPGETLNYIIEFKNTGEDIYRNLTLEIELKGSVLDFSSIKVTGGKVIGGEIVFSPKDFPDLLFLGPYGEGEVGFRVDVKEYTSSFHPQNAQILENVTFGVIEKSFQTKISSQTSFSQEVYYRKEKFPTLIKDVFENSGPFPLQSGQETTLVVVFNIRNLGNQLKGVKISTKLPENAEFLDKVYPSAANFSFNETTKELVLNVGNLSGYLPSKLFAFQIKISPQTLPTAIFGKTKITGKDAWTYKVFEIEAPPIDSDLIQ